MTITQPPTEPAGDSGEARSLTPREREVLDQVVVHYVRSGAPVASRLLSRLNSEGLSAASIRSIMADLEERGYVTHPHASAGKVPTDLGYRCYVDSLDVSRGLSPAEQAALARDLFASSGLDSLIARCCRVLAAASHHVAIGTAPDLKRTTFRHVDFIKLAESRLLVLFVDSSGTVYQHVLSVPVPESQADLDRYARFLDEQLAGATLSQVRERLAALMREERAAYDGLVRRALELGGRYFAQGVDRGSELVVGGKENLLDRPDVSEFDRMKGLLLALDDKARMLRLLDACLADDGVTTRIGAETAAPELADCSVVAASYGVDNDRLGTVAIIGPKRMEYERAMRLVAGAARLLGDALQGSRS